MRMKLNRLTLSFLISSALSLQANQVSAGCNIPEFMAANMVEEYLADTGQKGCTNDKSMGDKAVYMTDNRFDAYQAQGAIREAARSTAALILKSSLKKQGNYYVPTYNYTLRDAKWCKGESFINQPILASCTGFLVTDTTLVTAGHCFRGSGKPIGEHYVVFGYEMLNKGQANTRFPAKDVYLISEELEVKKDANSDWAVVQLDRVVNDRKTFEFKAGEIKKGTKLTLFGYPVGLPLKIANGGEVLENQKGRTVFATNVDAFQGNSGSPVLNSDGLRMSPPRFIVEGVLVAGAKDFKQVKGCKKIEPCQSINISYQGGNCSSEIVTKINKVVEIDGSAPEPVPTSAPIVNDTFNDLINTL